MSQDRREYATRVWTKSGEIAMAKVSSENQLADLLTKRLCAASHLNLTDRLLTRPKRRGALKRKDVNSTRRVSPPRHVHWAAACTEETAVLVGMGVGSGKRQQGTAVDELNYTGAPHNHSMTND